MRVLYVTGTTPPGRCGVGDYTSHLAQALRDRGHTVGVLSGIGGGPIDGVETLPVMADWRLARWRTLIRAVRSWRPDLVHFQYPAQGYGRHRLPWLMAPLTALAGLRVCQTWHEYYRQYSWIEIKGSLLNLPNALTPGGLVVVRPGYLDGMRSWYRTFLRTKTVRFIPNAPTIPPVSLSPEDRLAWKLTHGIVDKLAVVYFGFAIEGKGIEHLFAVADPQRHFLVLVTDLSGPDPYRQRLRALVESERWRGSICVTGFLPSSDVGRALAAADAIALPFDRGGGAWNTSLQAARLQTPFILTTSTSRQGLDADDWVYYAHPGDQAAMRLALARYTGQPCPRPRANAHRWEDVAEAHEALYLRSHP
jgi:glycosyltransferase involved in cell wall biosynthesis